MALLRVKNNLHEGAPKTFLSYPEASGVGTIRWQNANGFAASWAIQIGETGEEQTETVVLSTGNPSGGTAGTLTANTLYEHPANTPVYGIKYNQVVFEVSTSGTSGTATPITDGTVTYQPDSWDLKDQESYTIFDHTAGSSSYGYRTRFRSSSLSVTTDQSDWITFAGLDFYSLGKIRERAKNKLWDSSFISDEVADEWINECKDIMVNRVIQTNEDYALGTENIAFGTNGFGTITTADFSQIRRVWITTDGVNDFQSTKMNINDYTPGRIFSSTHPYHAFRGDNVIEVHPEGPGTAKLQFYRFGTTMVNETDTLPVPMRAYTDIFVDYVVSQALFKDQKDKEAQNKLDRVQLSINQFAMDMAPRDKSGPTMLDIVEPVSGEDWLY